MSSFPRPPIIRIPLIQGALLLPIAFAAWFYDTTAGYSVFLGGCIQILPNAVFAKQLFRTQGPRFAKHIFVNMLRGEAWKLVLSAIAFALVFIAVQPLNIIAFVAAYLLMVVVALVATTRILYSS